MTMRLRTMMRCKVATAGVSVLLAAGGASPLCAQKANVLKIPGGEDVRVTGSESLLRAGESVTLPVTIETKRDSRVIFRHSKTYIAIGANASCRIESNGDAKAHTGTVAVKPTDRRRRARVIYREILAEVGSLAIAHAPSNEDGDFKLMLFEGKAELEVDGEEEIELQPWQMAMIKMEDSKVVDEGVRCSYYDLEVAVETSALIKDFWEYWNEDGELEREVDEFKVAKRNGDFGIVPRHLSRRGSGEGRRERGILSRFFMRPRTVKNHGSRK